MKTVNNELIEKQKQAFRDKYQGKGSAARLGIIAAVQRASLYTPSTSHADILKRWEDKLNDLVEKYKTKQQTEETFKQDIKTLKDAMNCAFPPEQKRFNNGKSGYDNEFRIAHAQKSLSICLKHLWCRGELKNNTPPLCPVDGILLKSVHNTDSWTKVNSMKEYEEHIDLFKKKQLAQGYDNLSFWELMTWKSPERKKKDAVSSPKNSARKPAILLEPGQKLREGRVALFGYEIMYRERRYYLFVGEKTTFHYLELLTGKKDETLEGCDLISELRGRDFDYGGKDYIYKKLVPYDESDAHKLLEEIKKIMTRE